MNRPLIKIFNKITVNYQLIKMRSIYPNLFELIEFQEILRSIILNINLTVSPLCFNISLKKRALPKSLGFNIPNKPWVIKGSGKIFSIMFALRTFAAL